jgi:uncharacterized protein (TIGR03435 family)
MIRFLTVGFICCCCVFAQSFDVASIKPAAPMENGRIMVGMRGGPGTNDPGQMIFTNMSVSDLIRTAYDLKDYQIQGPSWMGSARFDIQAKVPAGATKAQSLVMLQNLLAERFKLTLHHSTKEESIYALVVAKGGPKLKESAAVDPNAPQDAAGPMPPPDGGRITVGKDGMPQMPKGAGRGSTMMMMAPGGRMKLVANGTTMTQFVQPLGNQLDRPVVDMTGLKGTYDITLEFAPDPSIMQAKMAAMGVGPPPGAMGPPPDGAVSPSGEGGPAATIFSALPDQLGLRLEARKGPVDLLLIDGVQKTPTEN